MAAEFAGVMPALDLAIEVTRRGGRTVFGMRIHPIGCRLQQQISC